MENNNDDVKMFMRYVFLLIWVAVMTFIVLIFNNYLEEKSVIEELENIKIEKTLDKEIKKSITTDNIPVDGEKNTEVFTKQLDVDLDSLSNDDE